jgi:hypothetical protein
MPRPGEVLRPGELVTDDSAVDARRHGGGQTVLLLVQGQTDVGQGALAGSEVLELGVHEHAVVVEQDVVLHGWST